jgi:hypothetical protein
MTWIMAGGQRIMTVFAEDAAIERIDHNRLAGAYLTRIEDTIDNYRMSREPRLLWLHAFFALVSTLVLVKVFCWRGKSGGL